MPDPSNEEQPPPMALPARLDHEACLLLRPEIEQHLGQPLRFLAADVSFVGGAGAELLLAAQAECTAKGVSFEIQSSSEAFQHGLAQLGLSETFQSDKG